MKLHLLTATALLAVSTAAFADGHFDRTLNVSSTPDLYVNTGSGNITVHAGSGNQIHIVGHVTSSWNLFGMSSDSSGIIHQVEENPPIAQDGNTIRVGFQSGHHDEYNHVSIDYDITAPAGVALNLHSGSGDVNTDSIGRYLTASTGSGNIRAHSVSGPADLQSGSGDITIDERTGGDVKARTGSGNVHIHGFNGALQARSGSGDIDADGHLTSGAVLESGSGNVRLHLGSDAHFDLEASTGSGDIRIRYPNAPQQDDHSRHHMTAPINGGGPPLQVRTGSGDVEIAS
ncbi:DUF4097 family beta strand repeat protein [Granulicella sp. 5B5]|uniref:DUF4097 family beta strand repeat-containing protein n=1 Tax=Granulicella sp. 5B5 TaxID=1617967 RepID=UPI0015F504CF|nr:DUF4097 family beta strand repeat-containing protein [Granulicella sp. 5B5]QMV17340.1 DUF4097 family beta strand repeat protein [Granulicella sp. 5B5]